MEVILTNSAEATIKSLTTGKTKDAARAKKVAKVLRFLAENPHHPSLASHRYEALDATLGEAIWESYIENRTPSAWRIWWYFGPEDGQITIVMIGPHP